MSEKGTHFAGLTSFNRCEHVEMVLAGIFSHSKINLVAMFCHLAVMSVASYRSVASYQNERSCTESRISPTYR